MAKEMVRVLVVVMLCLNSVHASSYDRSNELEFMTPDQIQEVLEQMREDGIDTRVNLRTGHIMACQCPCCSRLRQTARLAQTVTAKPLGSAAEARN